jgi:hypothetical protein
MRRVNIIPLFTVMFAALLFSACVELQYQTQETYYTSENITENRIEAFNQAVAKTSFIPREQSLSPNVIWSNPQLSFKGYKNIRYYGYELPNSDVGTNAQIKIDFFKQDYYEYLSVNIFDISPRGHILSPPIIAPSDNISSAIVDRTWISAQPDIITFHTWINLANIKLNFAHPLGGEKDIFLSYYNSPSVELNTRGYKSIAVIMYGPVNPQNCRFRSSLVWNDLTTENKTIVSERIVPVQIEQELPKQRTIIQTKFIPFWETLFK